MSNATGAWLAQAALSDVELSSDERRAPMPSAPLRVRAIEYELRLVLEASARFAAVSRKPKLAPPAGVRPLDCNGSLHKRVLNRHTNADRGNHIPYRGAGMLTTALFATALISQAHAGAAAPERFDVLIQAEQFVRGTVKAVRGQGWADEGGIIQCADNSPDWAEWEFEAPRGGVYLLFCRLAAQAPRPVDVFIDGTLIRRGALAVTTGGWRSSTARWFPVGPVPMKAGQHTLKILRATCIPHIDAFGLIRDPDIDLSQGPLAVPEDVWLDDSFAIQDWMIWTIGGIEQFTVQDGRYCITNGRHTLNRPLYATNGPDTVFGGDRPLVALLRGPTTKLGVLAAQIVGEQQRRWLHECETVQFSYDGACIEWRIKDPILGDNEMRLAVSALPDAEGFITRAEAQEEVQLSWWYGGLRGDYPDNRGAAGPLPGGRSENDCADNVVDPSGSTVTISRPDVAGAVLSVGVCPEARWEAVPAGEGLAGSVRTTCGSRPCYVVAAVSPEVLQEAAADPARAWAQARAHYDAIADRLAVDTPYPTLDGAVRGNNASMDGQWRPPSFLHGALRWGSECGGWYLGWRGWYGPIVAGDFERVKAAARFHFDRQFAEPDTGKLSKGKVASYVTFDGKPTKAGYNMHEVMLDHLKQYYWWTGDHELMKELWPKIKLALEYQRREIGKGLDGLYTNAVNTWISDGHHYNGNACAQASAYAVAHNTFAQSVARLVGDDAAFYAQEAEKTRREMSRRLWIADRGYFAEYIDGDGILHDAAEAPTIYHPIEMGAADSFQAYQMTRYADDRLWRFGDQILANDWFPVIVTNGLIGFNESANTALSYYHAGRFERAWRLLKVCCDSTAKAAVPGSISCYGARDGAQGTYVDFTDASSMLARTVVEGLFGLQPRVDAGRVEWTPRFPSEWDTAALKTRGFECRFTRKDDTQRYVLSTDATLEHRLMLPVPFGRIREVTVNGKLIAAPETVATVVRPSLSIAVSSARETVVQISGEGALPALEHDPVVCVGEHVAIRCPGGVIAELLDPQGVLADAQVSGDVLAGSISRDDGHHTAFVKVACDAGAFWAPLDIECVPPLRIDSARVAAVPGVDGMGLRLQVRNGGGEPLEAPAQVWFAGRRLDIEINIPPRETGEVDIPLPPETALTPGHSPIALRVGALEAATTVRFWRPFDITPESGEHFRAQCALLKFERNYTLSDIFTREYPEDAAPAPQLNNWTWYKTDCINTDAMRARAANGVLLSTVGVPFAVTTKGNDGLYVSRWRPFEQAALVPVGVRGDKLYLLLANHTHNSQTHMEQARVVLHYQDGTQNSVGLRSPGDIDGMLQHYSDMAPEWIGGIEQGWYGHGRASGVHADVTDINIDPSRELSAFELRCMTQETLIGLLGATVHRVGE